MDPDCNRKLSAADTSGRSQPWPRRNGRRQ